VPLRSFQAYERGENEPRQSRADEIRRALGIGSGGEFAYRVGESRQQVQDPGLTDRPLISDLFTGDERRPRNALEEQGLTRAVSQVVTEYKDRLGTFCAVQVLVWVRLEPDTITQTQTITQGPTDADRL
jgi:hypothetical protein